MMHMSQEYDFTKGKRGAIAPLSAGKTRITIRLDDEVLRWFRAQVHTAGGGNYQSLINLALREHVRKSAEPLEETLRRILREEFRGNPAGLGRVQRKTPMKKKALRKKVTTK
jgi:hypothetical protein